MNNKGQVVQEMVAGVVIVMIFFVVILVYSNQKNLEIYQLNETAVDKGNCDELAMLIESFSRDEFKNQVIVFEEKDFNVTPNSIEFENYYCHFFGKTVPAELSKGFVKIENDSNGFIHFSNV